MADPMLSYDIRTVTQHITLWADEVFPDRTPEGTISKMLEELGELAENPMDGWEIADVLILIFDLCDMLGFDPAKLVHNKMRVNRRRVWEVKNGVMHHVEKNENLRLVKGAIGKKMDDRPDGEEPIPS